MGSPPRFSSRTRPWPPVPARSRRSGWGIPALWIISLSLIFLSLGALTGYEIRLTTPRFVAAISSWFASGEGAQPGGNYPSPSASSQGGESAESLNLLILGSDARPGEGDAARTDAMMVLLIDPGAKRALLISIPRDLWVSIPGYGEGRINTAYRYGQLYGYPGGGAALAQRTVEGLLGIPLSHYVHIDFGGFIRLVDLLGGVEINVAQDIWDPLFPDEGYGYDPLYIPAGRQHMDGETLLKYVRTRHGGNDFDRMRRQQQALQALAQRALSLDLLPRLPDLLGTALDLIETDLSPLDSLNLAWWGQETGLEGLRMQALDESMTIPFVAADGAQVLLLDQEKIRAFMADILAEWQVAGKLE